MGFGRVTAVAGLSVLAVASIALASNGATQKATGKSRIAIRNLVSSHQSSDGTYKGRFVLVLNGVNQDSGTNFIRPANGQLRTVDGQVQEPVLAARNNLTGKRGTLTLLFRGVGVTIANIDPTKDAFGIEYGTWQITGSSGIYKGWKGGGRWANAYTPSANNIEWDGYVTH